MALPKVIHPTKKILIPSLGIEAEFEPFTTQDEKAIILLDQTSTLYDKSKLQLEILQKCCKTEGIDFTKFSVVEITYLFLRLRGISVGGSLDFTVTCPKCNKDIPASIAIDQIKIDFEILKKPLTFTINTDDGPYIVTASHVRVEDLRYIDSESPSMEDLAVILRTMMKPDGNDIIELTYEEKVELFNQLDTTIAEKLVEFINKTPTFQQHLSVECPECGEQFEGDIKDFFM